MVAILFSLITAMLLALILLRSEVTPHFPDTTFYYYDQRGCGDSTRPYDTVPGSSYHSRMMALDTKLGLGAQIADIERIRQILGQDKLTLIGHSFGRAAFHDSSGRLTHLGGFTCALYAMEFPDRVEKIIAVTPAPMLVFPSDFDLFKGVRARLPKEVQ